MMQLTHGNKTKLMTHGVILLPGFIPKRSVNEIKRLIVNELDRLELRKQGKLITSKFSSLSAFQQITRLSQMVRIGASLEMLFPKELATLIAQEFKETQRPSRNPPQLLLSFPHAENWSLKRLNWHVDQQMPKKDEVTGLQAFVLIDDVHPKGGATLALAGTHKLPYVSSDGKNSNAISILRRHPVFSQLFDDSQTLPSLPPPQRVEGIEISFIEMTGKAGDVYLMDMRVLHSPSINATKNLRMMATTRWTK